MSFADQSGYAVRFEWGLPGLRAIAGETIVLVDILAFTTSVSIACRRGATVEPCAWEARPAFGPRRPHEMLTIADEHLILPSQNGSAIAHAAMREGRRVIAGSIRNAAAVARWIGEQSVAIIAAGERWDDGTWRFAVEDLIGAGAVISHLQTTKSPEAQSAEAAFHNAKHDLLATLRTCSSGRELVLRGFDQDVALAAELDADDVVPFLSPPC